MGQFSNQSVAHARESLSTEKFQKILMLESQWYTNTSMVIVLDDFLTPLQLKQTFRTKLTNYDHKWLFLCSDLEQISMSAQRLVSLNISLHQSMMMHPWMMHFGVHISEIAPLVFSSRCDSRD